MAKDYYQILGIDRKASKDDIKKAFRKLAHKYHPDKKGGDESKFKEINEAYHILSNDQKRSEYDMYGNVFSGGSPGGQAGFGGFNWSDWQKAGGGVDFDLGDIFNEFFTGGTDPGRRVKRGRDISVDIQLNFSEAIFGTGRQMMINKVSTCGTCQGTGGAPDSQLAKCDTCGGQGQVRETRRSFIGSFTTVRECQACTGRGQTPDKRCPDCRGNGVKKQDEEIKINIPAGIADGEMIRLAGRGEAIPGGVPGDLYIKIHVDKHPIFRREGHNLVMDLDIKLTDALLGAEYSLATLDGDIKIKIPELVGWGEILRVKGKGVPIDGNRRGDILIKLVINMPKRLSRQAKKLIQELKAEGL